MTQEELDAMMSGEVDDIDGLEFEEVESDNSNQEKSSEDELDDTIPNGYNEETSHQWPLPATDENKMLHQLDDLTKEREEKAI